MWVRSPSLKYNAFISYSHAADGALAPALQRALHKFAKPWNRRWAVRVFRDETSLAASPELWTSIAAALADSEYFLLMASPRASASLWVRREIEWWLANRSIDRMLILVTEGDIAWDSAAGDFDWQSSTALPDCLRGRLRAEPLWVDLRWARSAENLDLHHSQFRLAILDIAAPLHHRAKDELDGEDVRQFKAAVRLRKIIIATLSVLVVALIGATWYAFAQRKDAILQAQIATARQLAAESDLMRERRAIELAAVLAGEAARTLSGSGTRSIEIDQSLRRTLAILPQALSTVNLPADSELRLSPDGAVLTSTAPLGCSVLRFDAVSGKLLGKVVRMDDGHVGVFDKDALKTTLTPTNSAYLCSGSDDGKYVVTRTIESGDAVQVEIWEGATGRRIATSTHSNRGHAKYWVSPGGRYLLTAFSNQAADGSWYDSVKLEALGRRAEAFEAREKFLGFSPDGQHFATANGLWRLPVDDSRVPRRVIPWNAPEYGFVFSAAGRFVAGREIIDGAVELYDVTRGVKTSVSATQGLLRAVSDDGRALMISHDVATLWDIRKERGLAAAQLFADAGALGAQPIVVSATDNPSAVSGKEFRTSAIAPVANAEALLPAKDGEETLWAGFRSADEVVAIVGSPETFRVDLWPWKKPGATTLRTVSRAKGAPAKFSVSDDGHHYALVDARGTVVVGDFRTNGPPVEFSEPQTAEGIALSRSGDFLAVAHLNRLRLWNVRTRALAADLKFVGMPTALAVAADGSKAVVVSRDEQSSRAGYTFTWHGWDSKAPTQLERIGLGRRLDFIDSLCKLSGENAVADREQEARIVTSVKSIGLQCGMASAEFDASFGKDELLVTERRSGKLIARIEQQNEFQLAAFSPEQTSLVTADKEGSLYLWPLITERLVAMVCKRLPQQYSDQSLQQRVTALCGR
jgi:WD40 repeat protein